LEDIGLKLTYSANKNGWNALKFHQTVDKLGERTGRLHNLECGMRRIQPKGWVGWEKRPSFVPPFSFNKDGSFIKLRRSAELAWRKWTCPRRAPSFGVDSLVIPWERIVPSKLAASFGSYDDDELALWCRNLLVQSKA
jgi:hypothetical protein